MTRASPQGTYATIWRWHFYAGLFVLPFVLVLAVTGSIYLFKPQIERWEERAFRDLPAERAVTPERQVAAALTAVPGGTLQGYRLPLAPRDAGLVRVADPTGRLWEVLVSPEGQVVGKLDPARRIAPTVSLIHGSLLLGQWGDRLVELVACWTIVMILSGLYLWWPRPFRLAGMLWPRLSLKGRAFLKDLHRVTGFWLSGLVLVLLVSGLPWAGAWGSAFLRVRTELGLIEGPVQWKVGTTHPIEAGHEGHGAMAMPETAKTRSAESLSLSAFVARARMQGMAYPVFVIPPHTPQRFGPPTGSDWTVKSETQNRPLARQVTYDAATGAETGRRDFADQHVIDRVVNTGVAWHEGQLFGIVNQLIGLATTLGLVTISILGLLLWLRRRPAGRLGAPPAPWGKAARWPLAALLVLALLLPLFGISLIALALLDGMALAVRRIRHPQGETT
jgi:uncharacterized iron-regulated membrane protein